MSYKDEHERLAENEYRARRRAARKKSGLCTKCGGQDAYTLNGRSLCSACAEKEALYTKKRRAGGSGAEEQKRVRENREIQGKCMRCGGPVEEGYKICKKCRTETSRNRTKRKIAQGMNWPRGSNGYCWYCNKEKAIDGKRVCHGCYEKLVDRCKKWTEASKKKEEK